MARFLLAAGGRVGIERHHGVGLLQAGSAGFEIGFQLVRQFQQLMQACGSAIRASAGGHHDQRHGDNHQGFSDLRMAVNLSTVQLHHAELPARLEVLDKVVAVWPLKLPPLDQTLFGEGLGLDSVDALELGLAIQKKYGIKIDAWQVISGCRRSVMLISRDRLCRA